MTRGTQRNRLAALVLVVCGFLGVAAMGCDGGLGAYGGGGYIEPMDFSPYGYDYSMYDIFTSDI